MSVFLPIVEDATCGWPHPRISQWACTLPFGHEGHCQHTTKQGVVVDFWPGPGTRKTAT